MVKEKKETKNEDKCCSGNNKNFNPSCNTVYGLGLIGALVYYISIANGFWLIILGILKALVWPAFLVFGTLKYLGL
jgi:hypothetical protein